MFKPLSLYIGTRYTNLKRRDHFITFISLVSMIGIALGVMILITVLSVMNGFSKEIRERILSVTPHLILYGPMPQSQQAELTTKLLSHPEVEQVAPFVEGQGMFTRMGAVRGVAIKGIDPNKVEAIFPLQSSLVSGSTEALKADSFGAILGERIAQAMNVQVGDKIALLVPDVTVSLVGAVPRIKQLKVLGTFQAEYTLDSSVAFVHYKDAQKLYKMQNALSGLQAKLKNPFDAHQVTYDLRLQDFRPYALTNWAEMNSTYFSAVQMEKRIMFLTLMMILAIAAFNLISTLVMVVTDKRSDIAILRTLGASRRKIMAIFVSQGSVIGIIGTGIGVVLGITLALNVEVLVDKIEQAFGVKFLSEEVYLISKLPSHLLVQDVVIVALASLLLSLLATIIPAYRAANVQPAEGLRYDS